MAARDPSRGPASGATQRDRPDPPEAVLGDVRPLLWTLAVTKLLTVALILWASRSFSTAALLAATTWFWLPVGAVLGGGWLLFRWRLLRVRRRREQLRRAEWLLDPKLGDVLPSPAHRERGRG